MAGAKLSLPPGWEDRIAVEKSFYSKRNQVLLGRLLGSGIAGDLVVVKIYRCPQLACREADILEDLRRIDLAVPRPLELEGRLLLLEYLPGPLLTDLLEGDQASGPMSWAPLLAGWLKKLHALPGERTGEVRLKGDVNPRNFLLSSGRMYGLDFESQYSGPPERDLGILSAFILAQRPAFTLLRRSQAETLVQAYQRMNGDLCLLRLQEEIRRELEEMVRRRPPEKEAISAFLAQGTLPGQT